LIEAAWALKHRPPSAPSSPAASTAWTLPSPLGRGQPSSACAPGSACWARARTSSPSWLPRSPGARRVLVGRDDRLTLPTAPSLARHRLEIGRGGAHIRTTRRDAAAAGPTPEQTRPWPVPGDRSQGYLPAFGRRAVPTREYQCGGQPIHADPARRATPGSRPATTRPGHAPPAPASTALGYRQRLRCQRGGAHLGLKPCHRPGRTLTLTSRSISVC
jgi:hypothetical protein